MIQTNKKKRLKKELKLFDVYAIATGTTISAGFFLLPGLAAEQAGSAVVLAYLIAAIPLIPAMFSIIELATAMPRAGGVYYFLDRSLGPAFGTIGGIGTWLALILKVSFALIGMGAYISLFFDDIPMRTIAAGLAIALGVLNMFGAKKTGGLQVVLVIGLLAILGIFIGGGVPEINWSSFSNMFDPGMSSIIGTAGLVYISYVGVTNVASLSEEISNPERNMPLGVILALTTAIAIYALGVSVMVGVLPLEELAGNMTPVASAGEKFLGEYGALILSVAAILAFISVANAGTMSASRYPLAMSRDNIIPKFFGKLSKTGTPYIAIILTVAVILAIIIFLDPLKIAKLASAFQLLLFAMVNLAVIIMRESKIDSYDPGFKSPLSPYLQIIGMLTPMWLIAEMGMLPLMFSLGLIVAGMIWYFVYAKKRVFRSGAVYHIFERLGRRRFDGLDREFRDILKEKGLRKSDPFDEIVARCHVVDFKAEETFKDASLRASQWFSIVLNRNAAEIHDVFIKGTKIGATPVIRGVALPHYKTDAIEQAEMVLVRSKNGMHIKCTDPVICDDLEDHIVYAVFFLISPESDPSRHLRLLAGIAERVEDENFLDEWFKAKGESQLKELLMHDDHFEYIIVGKSNKSEMLINLKLRDLHTPKGCLVAYLRRDEKVIIPNGSTILEKGDRLTVIGETAGLNILRNMYCCRETL
ncbi:MAG: amino acid permease [Candidatus Kapabacteria bacterium]|jgi:APA family basic amino acid/polyamine antiporter|nr:amino acid permease [Candidatus Kapabacteria bacterium]